MTTKRQITSQPVEMHSMTELPDVVQVGTPQALDLTLKCCPVCGMPLKFVHIGGRDRFACTACEFVHWNNPRPVTATLVPMDGGLVLVKRNIEPFIGDWCLPGGFIEAAEHPDESAIREVEEETGLKVDLNRLLLAAAPGKNINVVILFYLAHPASGTLRPGDDADDVQVFKQHELPQNIAFELHRKMTHQFFKHAGNPSEIFL